MPEAFAGGIGIALFVFLVVLAIAWIIMPFAIIGTKPLLREVVAELKLNNQLLREAKQSAASPSAQVGGGPTNVGHPREPIMRDRG